MRYLLVVLVFALAPVGAAQAHDNEGASLTPENWWRAWHWDLPFLMLIGLAGWRYTQGVRALWRRAGQGRGVRRWQVAAFWTGLTTLFVAVVSPVDALGKTLLSAHMLQHMLLTFVAAPLLLLGAPPAALAWAMPAAWRGRMARWWHRRAGLQAALRVATRPLLAWTVFAVILWTWHVPALYEAALHDERVHVLEHISFLGSALLFWWVALQPGGKHRLGLGAAPLFIFTTSVHSGFLGFLMVLSSTPWYPAYAPFSAAWGRTPLEDQQLAGLLMWVVGGMLFTVPALAVLWQWLSSLENTHRSDLSEWHATLAGHTTDQ